MNKIVYQIDNLENKLTSVDKLDYFIIASGSDYRAYEVLRKYNKKDISLDNLIIFNFHDRISNNSNHDPIYDYNKIGSYKIIEIFCDIKNPSSCLDDFAKIVIKKTHKIGIDISCFTKPYL